MTQHRPFKAVPEQETPEKTAMSSAASGVLPTVAESISRARSDLRLGLPCLAFDGARQAIVTAVEPLGQARLDALRGLFGEPELVLTANRASAVMATRQGAEAADSPVRIQPPKEADITWFQRLVTAELDEIGSMNISLQPTIKDDSGIPEMALRLVKSIELLPAALVFPLSSSQGLPAELRLAEIDLAEFQAYAAREPIYCSVASAHLPIETNDMANLHVFRDSDGITEHYAVEIGKPERNLPALVRLHSACFTGDVLGSLKCDCGPQLRAALTVMGEHGSGVLLYLNQEGRGIGLANKMRVYGLQAQGLDTVEANHRLGFADDERDFRVAAVMLRRLGFDGIRLLTNNPAKVASFRDNGIEVLEQLPLRVGKNAYNSDYLAVKALKSGHSL